MDAKSFEQGAKTVNQRGIFVIFHFKNWSGIFVNF